MDEKIRKCINAHAAQAYAISFLPLVSVPLVYGVCAKMIMRLDRLFGIRTSWGPDSEIAQDIFAGIIAAPALIIPVLGGSVASAFIKSVGENYARAVTEVANAGENLSEGEFARRVKEELQKFHAAARKKRKERAAPR